MSSRPVAFSSTVLIAPWSGATSVSLVVPWSALVRRLHVLSPDFEVRGLRVTCGPDRWAEARLVAAERDVRTYAFAEGIAVDAGAVLDLSVQNHGSAPGYFEAQLVCETGGDRPRLGAGTAGLRDARPTVRHGEAAPTLRIVEVPGLVPMGGPALGAALADALEAADLARIAALAEGLAASSDARALDPRPVWRALARFATRRP